METVIYKNQEIPHCIMVSYVKIDKSYSWKTVISNQSHLFYSSSLNACHEYHRYEFGHMSKPYWIT